ncbi:DUF5682 family protein [Photobacterium damselae]|uniref:DUF5682 family protein n=1 Tax=Photobacterium damselae TaxID=38293 RepID=UPI002542B7CE
MQDCNPALIWAPIRHHSPMCSWQLVRLIQQSKPDVILIETPADAQEMLSFLQHKQTTPPIALYLHASWQEQDEIQSRCGFIPFAKMSPEWNALREAAKRRIPCEFIDLPYAAWRHYDEKVNQDHLLYQESLTDTYLSKLLVKTQCDNFDQWWDRYIENQHRVKAVDFFQILYQFGLKMRECAESIESETLNREQYMADCITPHLAAGRKVLVVCGAYHCLGIEQHLTQNNAEAKGKTEPRTGLIKGCHLVPYPLSRLSDPRYGARFARSRYYDLRWHKLKNSTKAQRQVLSQELHTQLASEFMLFLQQKSYPIAMPQLVDVVVNAEHLAQLRGIEAGRSEFEESAQLVLEKDPVIGASTSRFQLWLNEFFSDPHAGLLPPNLPIAPIVADFRRHCTEHKLPLSALAGSVNKDLAIYRRKHHRLISQWLHRLAFLQIPYAHQVSGPNFISQTQLERVREGWQIQWSIESEAALVELSHQGSTVNDVVHARLQQQYYDPSIDTETCARLLLGALQMGMQAWLTPLVEQVTHRVEQETDLNQLQSVLTLLLGCSFGSSILSYQIQKKFNALISSCYVRICARLPRSCGGQAVTLDGKFLSQMMKMSTLHPRLCPAHYLLDAIKALELGNISLELQGSCIAVIYQLSTSDVEHELLAGFTYAQQQSYLDPDALGDFCYGLWQVAPDIYHQVPKIREILNKYLQCIDNNMFLQVLPALRRAFMVMSPQEISDFAQWSCGTPILSCDIPDAEALKQAKKLQQVAQLWLQQWGI